MRLGTALLTFLFALTACGSQGQSRAEYIRFLADRPVDLKLLPELLSALDDKNPDIRLAALRTWEKVGNEYDSEYSSVAYDEEQDASSTDVTKSPASLRQSIIAKIRPRDSDGPELILQSLRTMCKLGDGAEILCPPIEICGTGIEQSLSYMAEQELKHAAAKQSLLLESLLSDRDPDIVFNSLLALDSDFLPAHKSFVLELLHDQNK